MMTTTVVLFCDCQTSLVEPEFMVAVLDRLPETGICNICDKPVMFRHITGIIETGISLTFTTCKGHLLDRELLYG